MDKKNIDLQAISNMLFMFEMATDLTVDKFFDEKLPEDPDGPEFTRQQLYELKEWAFQAGKEKLKEMGYELPAPGIEFDDDENPIDPDFPVDPVPDVKTITIPKTNKISINGIWRDRFVFPKVGPAYGKKLVFKWDNGEQMVISDSSKRWQASDHSHKYQPGSTYSYNPPDPKIPTMEVYLKPGSHASSVTMQYLEDVDLPDPVDPNPESEWTRIDWGGDPNESSEGRSRRHWTKIHGSTPKWWRKFPLPTWMDDKSYSVDFRFSDGTTFHVPDTRRMYMDPDGPKYRYQDSNEPDKTHPKISEKYGAKAEWVEYKVR